MSAMRATSGFSTSSRSFADTGRAEVESALAAMSPPERLTLFWRAQEIAIARSWALVHRSGLQGERAGVELVIRSRYPEWSDAEVQRLLGAICQREDPAAWLERLRLRAGESQANIAGMEQSKDDIKR